MIGALSFPLRLGSHGLLLASLCLFLAATSVPAHADEPTDSDKASPREAKDSVLPDGRDWERLRETYLPFHFERNDRSLPYRLMLPPGFDPSSQTNKKYPLVLFLHGAGERGDDNLLQLMHGASEMADENLRRRHPAFVVFPQCPKDHRWVETDWTIPEGEGTFPEEPSINLSLALGLVQELIDGSRHQASIDPDRVYVTGLSMGGYGTWHAAALLPDVFAAALPVCGGSDPNLLEQYKGMPIWAFHGDKDNVVPIKRGREIIELMKRAGPEFNVRYTEYPGVGHDAWSPTYGRDDIYDWLFAQHRQQRR